MPGIDPSFICHKLAIFSKEKCKLGKERRKSVVAETNKLLKENFIREVE